MAKLKGYISKEVYLEFRSRYKECIRMLNGLEKTSEQKIPKQEQRWQIAEEPAAFDPDDEPLPHGSHVAAE
jgi:hypothetical protein